MMYYKVKPEHDNERKFVYAGSEYKMKKDGILIANELYTPRERKKIANSDRFFDIVEIPKSKTYRFFGARLKSTIKRLTKVP